MTNLIQPKMPPGFPGLPGSEPNAGLSIDELLVKMSSYNAVEPQRAAVEKLLTAVCKLTAGSALHNTIVSYLQKNILDAYLDSVISKNRGQIVNDLLGLSYVDTLVPAAGSGIEKPVQSCGSDEKSIPPAAGSGENIPVEILNPLAKNLPTMANALKTSANKMNLPSVDGSADSIAASLTNIVGNQSASSVDNTEEDSKNIRKVLEASTDMIIKHLYNESTKSSGDNSVIFKMLVQKIIDRATDSIQTNTFSQENSDIFNTQMKPVMDTIHKRFYFSTKRLLMANLDNLQKQVNKASKDIDNDMLTSYVDTLFQLFYVETNHQGDTELSDKIQQYVETIKSQPEILNQTIEIMKTFDQTHANTLLRDIIGGIQFKEDPEKPPLLESFKKLFASDEETPQVSRVQQMTDSVRNLGSTVKTFLTRNPTKVAPSSTSGGKRTKRRVYKRGNKKNLTIRKRK